MPTRVVLVRHAQSKFNALHIIQGQLDLETPLDAVGLAQVARGAPVCAALHKDCRVVYTSDFSRAAVTAAAIATELGVECVRDSRLRERHLGVLQGLPRSELATATPEAYRAFKSRDIDVEIPGGGESARSVDARLREFFRDVAKRHAGEKIIAVTHGGVLGRISLVDATKRIDLCASFGEASVIWLSVSSPWTRTGAGSAITRRGRRVDFFVRTRRGCWRTT